MAAIRLMLVYFALTLCCFLVDSSYPVPVLMWSKDSTLSPEQPLLAGHTLSSLDFQEKYLKRVLQTPQTVCLFLQDRLSIDDFTHYGNAYSPGSHGDAFSNLKNAMNTANSSIVLPSVDAISSGVSNDLVAFIKENIKGQLIVIDEDELKSFVAENYAMDNKVTNVFIFHLHPVDMSSPETAAITFKQNDDVIAMVTAQIAHLQLTYTCILTGQAPNQNVNEQIEAAEISSRPHDRLRRTVVLDQSDAKLSAEFKNGSLFVNGGCVFMYLSGIVLKGKNMSTVNFFNQSDTVTASVTSHCSNMSVSLSLKLTIGKLKSDLSFVFNGSRRDWQCISISLTTEGLPVDKDLVFPCAKQIQVPLHMSFHCYNVVFNGGNYTLQLSNFQVQPFAVKGRKFSYAYDCVGFFSIPILMGLLTMAILLIILFLGIMAVFSITTMDRFDDPKSYPRSFGTTAG